MRGLFGLIMYAGGVASVLAFFLPSLNYRIGGLEVPMSVARQLPWISLGMVAVGYVGRRALRRDDL